MKISLQSSEQNVVLYILLRGLKRSLHETASKQMRINYLLWSLCIYPSYYTCNKLDFLFVMMSPFWFSIWLPYDFFYYYCPFFLQDLLIFYCTLFIFTFKGGKCTQKQEEQSTLSRACTTPTYCILPTYVILDHNVLMDKPQYIYIHFSDLTPGGGKHPTECPLVVIIHCKSPRNPFIPFWAIMIKKTHTYPYPHPHPTHTSENATSFNFIVRDNKDQIQTFVFIRNYKEQVQIFVFIIACLLSTTCDSYLCFLHSFHTAPASLVFITLVYI